MGSSGVKPPADKFSSGKSNVTVNCRSIVSTEGKSLKAIVLAELFATKRRCAAMRSLATSIDNGALDTHAPSAGASAALEMRRKSWSTHCREGPPSCISNSGEVANDEDGNRQRLDPRKREHNRVIRITVGPSEPCCSPSRPTAVRVTRGNMSLEESNARSIRRSARKKKYGCKIRRAEPENAAAIEAAAPSAHYYEPERIP